MRMHTGGGGGGGGGLGIQTQPKDFCRICTEFVLSGKIRVRSGERVLSGKTKQRVKSGGRVLSGHGEEYSQVREN